LTPVPLLVNPAARGGRTLAQVRAAASNAPVEIRIARDIADFDGQVRRAVEDGTPRLLVAGGDGTLHAAIQLLAGTDCALGIVPSGRGNDLARSLGVPLDPAKAIEVAIGAVPRRIDLGTLGGRYFAGVAAVGFDGEVARFVQEHAALGAGPLAYPYAVLRTLLRFRPPHFRIEHDGGIEEGPGMLAAVANASCYGGGMRIAPSARLDDEMLDLVFVRAVGKLRLLRLFPRVYRGTHVGHPAVVVRRTRRAVIRLDRSSPIFGDGEPLAEAGPEGIEIGLRPAALRVAA
jgi:diacylglycerol kinase (ATP)